MKHSKCWGFLCLYCLMLGPLVCLFEDSDKYDYTSKSTTLLHKICLSFLFPHKNVFNPDIKLSFEIISFVQGKYNQSILNVRSCQFILMSRQISKKEDPREDTRKYAVSVKA